MKSKIYSKTGDKGKTSLLGGERVYKNKIRVEAYGSVDEANSFVGAAGAFVEDEMLAKVIEFLQHRLFVCSSNLAQAKGGQYNLEKIDSKDVEFLETAIDCFEQRTGPLKSFVLPGGSKASGLLHLARTVVRRAERRTIDLQQQEGENAFDPLVLNFINRASDLLFAAARYANIAKFGKSMEIQWNNKHPRPDLNK